MPHIHEKIDFTVEVLIVFNKRVLLRKHDKYKKWLGVGGHIELNEDPVQAAIREAKEEVGLDVEIIGNAKEFNIPDYQELIPPKFLNRHKINETHEHVSLIYLATSKPAICVFQIKRLVKIVVGSLRKKLKKAMK